jgi:trimeric autotransporter adhesin
LGRFPREYPCKTARMKIIGFFGGLILAALVSSLISCGNTVDFGFPFTPPGTTSLVEITPANPSVPIGVAQQFTATGTQPNGTSTDITSQVIWTSSNTSVATVNGSGLAIGLTPGIATITATFGSASGTATLTVTPATLSSISVTPNNPSIPLGFTLQLAGIGTFLNGTAFDMTTQVIWSSSNNSVATVDSAGVVRGIALGIATITATSGNIFGITTVRVIPANLGSISLTPANPTIPGTPAGITQQFTATGAFSDGMNLDITSQVLWSSSNLSVAAISSTGLATSAGPGFSIITATFQTISASTTLTVNFQALTSISVTPANSTVFQGKTQQFTATATYSDGTTRDVASQVTWRSDNIAAARVDSIGLATAVAPGSATITASSGSFSGSAVLTVTP